MAVALVTGASSGIGLATAVTLARGGHAVIATMRNPNGAGDLRKIVTEEKLPVEVAALNVDEDASVREAIGKALAERGHIDVLVNNAGVGGGGAVEEVPLDFSRQMMETNFFGALRCMKAVIPSMRTSSWLHYQCDLRCGSRRNGPAGSLCRLQIRSRSSERVFGAGNEAVQRARRHHRTRRHCNADIQQGETAARE